MTRNPWNEAEARWVYDSNANSVEDQGANRSGDKKKHGAATSVGRPGLLSLLSASMTCGTHRAANLNTNNSMREDRSASSTSQYQWTAL